MTPDQLLAVVLWCAAGLYLGARLNYLRRDLDICRIGDEHVETRGYVMGHTCALDAHDERLQALEDHP